CSSSSSWVQPSTCSRGGCRCSTSTLDSRGVCDSRPGAAHNGRMNDLLDRLSRVDTASLCDADPGLRVVGPELRPIGAGLTMVGRAVTADAGDDLMAVLGALDLAGPGDVLVVASGVRRAMAGELFVTEARRRGLAGLVVDGFCRDVRMVVSL